MTSREGATVLDSETIVVCRVTEAKRAYMLFDRVFMLPGQSEVDLSFTQKPTFHYDPAQYAEGVFPLDAFDESVLPLILESHAKAMQRVKTKFKIDSHFSEKVESVLCNDIQGDIWMATLPKDVEYYFRITTTLMTDCFINYINRPTVLIPFNNYDPAEAYDAEPAINSNSLISAVFNHIPIITNNNSWKQLQDFKRDKESLRKYRDLRNWIRECELGKSHDYYYDLIQSKVDDYNFALKKHGLVTLIGALTTVTTCVGAASLLAHFGSIPSTLLTNASGSLYVAGRQVDREAIIRGQHREIAIIHDIQKRFD